MMTIYPEDLDAPSDLLEQHTPTLADAVRAALDGGATEHDRALLALAGASPPDCQHAERDRTFRGLADRAPVRSMKLDGRGWRTVRLTVPRPKGRGLIEATSPSACTRT